MNTTQRFLLRFSSVAAASLLLIGSAQAHTAWARVVSVQPEYTQVRIPERVCDHRRGEYSPRHLHQHDRCYTVERVENKVTGYRVTYDYHGTIGSTYTRHHPGRTIEIEVRREREDDRHRHYHRSYYGY